jgi:ribosome-binding factor A
MLEYRVKDPRLGFVTITDCRITGDLREATVYYTVYGSAEGQAETAAALKSATGLIRSEVGRQTGVKHTPSLEFIRDTVPEGAATMEELVARARAADQALAEAREGAQPAGDPDPYRVPRSDADEDEDGLDDDDEDGFGEDEDEDGFGPDGADEYGADEYGADEYGAGEAGAGGVGAGGGGAGIGDASLPGDPRDGALGRGYPAPPGNYDEIDARGGAARRRR